MKKFTIFIVIAIAVGFIYCYSIASEQLEWKGSDINDSSDIHSGHIRYQSDGIVITAIRDGYILSPVRPLKSDSIEQSSSITKEGRRYQTLHQDITSINVFLIDSGGELVLIDAGAGDCFGPSAGKTISNMQAAGYKPAHVDSVLLTHLHADHVCGLVSKGDDLAFNNAIVYLSQNEISSRFSPQHKISASGIVAPLFDMNLHSLQPYIAINLFRTFIPGESVLPGIVALPTPGHSPGHTSFLLDSGQTKILFLGGTLRDIDVQRPYPEISTKLDTDRKTALASRNNILKTASEEKWIIAGAHLPFPGIGYIKSNKSGGYNWQPLDKNAMLPDVSVPW